MKTTSRITAALSAASPTRASRNVCATLAAALTLATSATHAATWFVSPDGNDTDGQSWATAKRNLQVAINLSAAGDEIIVGNGTYAPISTSNKALSIRSANGRDVTIIDGGNTTRCATLGSEPGHTNSVLTGFTLRNGRTQLGGGGVCYGRVYDSALTSNTVASTSNDGWVVRYRGGGAYQSILNNCTLTGNRSSEYGGGASDCTLNNCTLTGNTAPNGGGVYYSLLNNCTLTGNSATGNYGYGGGAANSTLNYCTLTGNTASTQGGGAYSNGGGSWALNHCLLSGNSVTASNNGSASGGGAHYITLNNCTLTNNTVSAVNGTASGGGASQCPMNNCTLVGNKASTTGSGSAYGGGTDGWYDTRMNHCILINNTASATGTGSANGGGASGGDLRNCLLAENTASATGGGYAAGGGSAGGGAGATLYNCTVANNIASSTGETAYGGGVNGTTSNTSRLYNCIVWGNTVYHYGTTQDNNWSTYITANYSCTTPIPTSGTNNKTDNPLFANAGAGDYRLQAGSPCVNAGSNSYVSSGALDLDGNPRIHGGTVDMGAYEHGSFTPPTLHDFVFCRPTGWSDSFFLSKTSGTPTPVTSFEQGEPIYLWYAFWDDKKLDFKGSMTNVISVLVNGVTQRYRDSYTNYDLPGNYYTGFWSTGLAWLALQNLAPGTYTLTLTLNDGNVVPETNYANNTKSVTFTVTGAASTTVTVTFNPNSGAVTPTSKSVTSGQTYGALPTPMRTGHTFDGWYTAQTGGTLVTASTTVTQTAAHTLYARWTADDTPPPEDDPYLSDPEDAQGSALLNTTAYDGFVYDGNKTVRGTLTFNAKVDKKDNWTLSAKAVLQTAAVSFSAKQTGPIGDVTLTAKGGERLVLTLRAGRLYGTLSGGKAGGAFTVDGARSDKVTRTPGLYNVALLSGGGTDTSATRGYLSLSVGNAGAVKLAGSLADGTKVSGSARLLAGLNADGWLAAALYSPLYSKNGFISGLLWIDLDRSVRVDADNGWLVDWKRASSSVPDRLDVLGGYFGDGKTARMPVGPLWFSADVPTASLPSLVPGGAWREDMYPTGLSVTINGLKLVLPPKNPSDAKITYTAKTGLFKGTFKLYCGPDAKGKDKAASASYAGMMVPVDGTLIGLGTGTTTVNKQKVGMAVWIGRELRSRE